jgi:hypothetical protein
VKHCSGKPVHCACRTRTCKCDSKSNQALRHNVTSYDCTCFIRHLLLRRAIHQRSMVPPTSVVNSTEHRTIKQEQNLSALLIDQMATYLTHLRPWTRAKHICECDSGTTVAAKPKLDTASCPHFFEWASSQVCCKARTLL